MCETCGSLKDRVEKQWQTSGHKTKLNEELFEEIVKQKGFHPFNISQIKEREEKSHLS